VAGFGGVDGGGRVVDLEARLQRDVSGGRAIDELPFAAPHEADERDGRM
jgi:hypothetical protein